jgi:cell division protein FtsW
MRLKQTPHPPDKPLLIGVILLLLFGVVMVYDASVVYAQGVFGGKYHFLLLQLLWVSLGTVAAFVVYRLGYHYLCRLGVPLLLVSLGLLFLLTWPNIPLLKHLLFIPHDLYDRFVPEIYGARRWLVFPGKLSFQPSELAKFSSILYFSSWLVKKERPTLLFLLLLILLTGLVLLEPDFGTAVVLASIILSIYFVSGVSLLKLIPLGILGILGGLILIISSPYRMQRLQTYLNPAAADPLASGYHIQQVLIALGSGGPLGLGFGQSRQKYEYLPEVMTDSIFAVIGEELGFVGAVVVVSVFAFLLFRGLRVAAAADDLGKLIAVGATSWLGVQVLVNLAAMTALIPLTGVPLPLISYGGSSTVLVMMAIGLLLSVSRYTARGS